MSTNLRSEQKIGRWTLPAAAMALAIGSLAILLHGLGIASSLKAHLLPQDVTLRIQPLPAKPQEGQLGGEIWIYRIRHGKDELVPVSSIPLSEGWIRRGESLVALSAQAAPLRINGLLLPLTIDFGRHAYSGSGLIKAGGQKERVDLFCNSQNCPPLPLTIVGQPKIYPLILGGLYGLAALLGLLLGLLINRQFRKA